MNLRNLCALALLPLLSFACRTTHASLPAGDEVGRGFESREVHDLGDVMAEPAAHFDQTLIVRGTVTSVCQNAGCWMQIADGDVTTMVRWDTGCGGEFAFPKDCAGRDVFVQGSFYAKEITPEDKQHLEEESGGTLAIPEQVYELNATAVLFPAAPAEGTPTR